MIDIQDLKYYLKSGYEEFLPDDIPGGTVPTDQLVKDFVAFHLELEARVLPPFYRVSYLDGAQA